MSIFLGSWIRGCSVSGVFAEFMGAVSREFGVVRGGLRYLGLGSLGDWHRILSQHRIICIARMLSAMQATRSDLDFRKDSEYWLLFYFGGYLSFQNRLKDFTFDVKECLCLSSKADRLLACFCFLEVTDCTDRFAFYANPALFYPFLITMGPPQSTLGWTCHRDTLLPTTHLLCP